MGGNATRWIVSPTAVYSDLDGMTALLETRSNVYYCLPETGSLIWDRLREGDAIEQICEAVTTHYDVPAATARADVSALVDRLHHAGLIVSANG